MNGCPQVIFRQPVLLVFHEDINYLVTKVGTQLNKNHKNKSGKGYEFSTNDAPGSKQSCNSHNLKIDSTSGLYGITVV